MDLSWICCFSQAQGSEEAEMPKVRVSRLGLSPVALTGWGPSAVLNCFNCILQASWRLTASAPGSLSEHFKGLHYE